MKLSSERVECPTVRTTAVLSGFRSRSTDGVRHLSADAPTLLFAGMSLERPRLDRGSDSHTICTATPMTQVILITSVVRSPNSCIVQKRRPQGAAEREGGGGLR